MEIWYFNNLRKYWNNFNKAPDFLNLNFYYRKINQIKINFKFDEEELKL